MFVWLKRLFGPPPALIQRAGPTDAAPLARLHGTSFHRGWSEQEMSSLLIERNVLAHKARVRNVIIGFILSRAAGDEAEILSVAVRADARGSGAGRALLMRNLSELAGLGIRTVFLEVEENNEPALRLYRRAGFAEVGRRAAYYRADPSEAADALVMRRDL